MNTVQTFVYGVLPYIDLPDGAATPPPGTGKFGDVMGWLKWVALSLLAVLLIAAFVQNGKSNKRGDASEAPEWIGRILVGAIGVTAAVSLIGFLAP